MKNGFKIIDSDLHVIEPPNIYQDYIDPRFRDLAPRWTGHPEHGNGGWVCQDNVHTNAEWLSKDTLSRELLKSRKKEYYTAEDEQGYTAELTLKAMDREGIDVAILFRTAVGLATPRGRPRPGFHPGTLPGLQRLAGGLRRDRPAAAQRLGHAAFQ